ncbi:MAG: hypothetical protein ACK4M7_05330 [Burkholderiales bacterium]
MIYDLVFTNSYKVKEKQFLKSHRDLADIYAKILVLLRANLAYSSLRLHLTKNHAKAQKLLHTLKL